MKITAEARKHMITRNSVSYRVTLKTFSMKDGSQGEISVNVSGDFSSEQDMLGYVATRNTTSEIAVVPVAVKPVEKLEDRRAMFDDDFFRYGHILKDDEKITGLMVRTLKIAVVHCVSADFEKREFNEDAICVIGSFENAEDAVTWYKKRTPNDKKVYGNFSGMESNEVKVAIPVNEFYNHSFSITDEKEEV